MALALDDARLGAATDAWLLYRVWSFMSGAELARSVMPVCKRWNALARDVHATRDADGPADQLWTTLLHRDFPMAPRIVALARAPPAVATEVREHVGVTGESRQVDIFSPSALHAP